MNRNKKITQTMALAMTGIMIANAGMGSVYAADQTASVEKETESTTEAVTEKEKKETDSLKLHRVRKPARQNRRLRRRHRFEADNPGRRLHARRYFETQHEGSGHNQQGSGRRHNTFC